MSFEDPAYDKKTMIQSIVMMVVSMLAQKFTGGYGYAFVAPLALLALMTGKSVKVLFWVVVSISLMMGNGYLMPRGPIFFFVQRGLFLAIGIASLGLIFGHRIARQISPLCWLLPYLLYMVCASAVGWCPIISWLKLLLFTIIYFAYFGLANRVSNLPYQETRKARSVVLAMSCFFIFGSVLLVPFPAISQLSGEEYTEMLKSGASTISLFKGMCMHSQGLGPLVAAIGVFLFADFAFSIRRPNKLYLALLLCCPYLLYKSSCRAGMASYLLGYLFVGWCLMLARGVGSRWRSKILNGMMGIVVVAVCAAVFIPQVRQGVVKFTLKYTTEENSSFSMEETMSTRQGLIDRQKESFKKSPIVGNGFQVSEQMAGLKNLNWKQMMTAPIEKGVWLTAVLEEGGICGMILIWFFILVAGIKMLRARAYIGLSVLFTLFVCNMAEFTLFSMSADGGFIWALVFIGAALDAERERQNTKGGQLCWR